ncbi:hypothetical protein RsoM2USA_97 [Ralstonia phage RsoM2USA]|nr:hypothetical protein RsoM2USA_97 [Ralstonia phage RsoM2USA]
MKRVLVAILVAFSVDAFAGDCNVQLNSEEFSFNLNAITGIEAITADGKSYGLILKFNKVGHILLEFPSKADLAAGIVLMGKTAIENECSVYVQRFVQQTDKPMKQETPKRSASRVQA